MSVTTPGKEYDMQPIQLADPKGLDFEGLCQKWQKLFRRKPPQHLPEYVMRSVIAYRLQAEASGDLDKDCIVYLNKVAIERNIRLASPSTKSRKSPPPVAAVPTPFTFKPGSILVREYGGKTHRVTVGGPRHFTWMENGYRSLSEVAHAITGTNWNGPRFFGLRSAALIQRSVPEGSSR